MRITKEQAAKNREALVATAARLFRERGFDGVGVADLSKEAGLTHGALYAHFPSKEALAAEALRYGASQGNAYLHTLGKDGRPTLQQLLDWYLSPAARDNLAEGCTLAATSCDAARQDRDISASYSQGYANILATVAASLAPGLDEAERRRRAMTISSAMLGALSTARAVAKADPALSDELLSTARTSLLAIGALA